MRAGGSHRGARTISLALVAGLIAFEANLVLSAGAISIPGLYLVRLGTGSAGTRPGPAAPEGGESVIAKFSATEQPSSQTPAGAAAKPLSPVPPEGGAPRLDGLADIPLTPWDRRKAKPDHPKAFAANSSGREMLPWDAVEPVPFSPDSPAPAPTDITATLPDSPPQTLRARAAPLELPASSEVAAWIKAKATEIKGEDRARPLYHFEFWLEPPEEVKRRVVVVVYDFNTPALMPQSQISSEQKTDFRVSAGGLTCADKVTVTLKFDDGRTEQVAVDGCKLLG
jgi:hypothetical protein